MKIVRLDHLICGFAIEEEGGSIGFEESEIDNALVLINGRKLVLRIEESPNSETLRLLSEGDAGS